jgi:hypothetical protein
MCSDFLTHLRAIRSAEDRLRLLVAARDAYCGAMREYLAKVGAEIRATETELADAHTARIDGSEPCQPPARRLIRRQLSR